MSTSRRNSWSDRLGKVAKRSASLLSKSRRSSISSQESDSGSLSKVNAPSRLLTDPAILPALSGPSPIAESPAREAAMTSPILQLGPSPLAQPTTGEDKPAQTADEVVSIPTEHVPVLDSSAGKPGAFTSDPEELPAPELAHGTDAPPTPAIEGPQQEHKREDAEPADYQESDRVSLSKINAALGLLPPPLPLTVSSPSPAAEPPARQAAIEDSTSVGPSHPTQPTIEGNKPAEIAGEVVSIPAEYIPPPVIDYSVGNPGAFTDDPDELPPAELIDDPYARSRPASFIEEPQQEYQPEYVELAVEVPQHLSVEAAVQPPEKQQEPVKVAAEAPQQEKEGPVKAAVEAPEMEMSVSLLDKSMESIHDFELVERATLDFVKIVRENTADASVSTSSQAEQAYVPGMENSEPPEYYPGKFKVEQPAPSVHEQEEVAVPKWVGSHHESELSYSLPSYSGHGWGGIPVVDDHNAYGTVPDAMPLPSPEGNDTVHASHVNEPSGDPFVDPVPKITGIPSDASAHHRAAAPDPHLPETDQTRYSTDKGKNSVEEDPHPTQDSLPSRVKAMALDAWDRAQAQFKAHPTWPIIGVGGAIAGMLATSLLLSRR